MFLAVMGSFFAGAAAFSCSVPGGVMRAQQLSQLDRKGSLVMGRVRQVLLGTMLNRICSAM